MEAVSGCFLLPSRSSHYDPILHLGWHRWPLTRSSPSKAELWLKPLKNLNAFCVYPFARERKHSWLMKAAAPAAVVRQHEGPKNDPINPEGSRHMPVRVVQDIPTYNYRLFLMRLTGGTGIFPSNSDSPFACIPSSTHGHTHPLTQDYISVFLT